MTDLQIREAYRRGDVQRALRMQIRAQQWTENNCTAPIHRFDGKCSKCGKVGLLYSDCTMCEKCLDELDVEIYVDYHAKQKGQRDSRLIVGGRQQPSGEFEAFEWNYECGC